MTSLDCTIFGDVLIDINVQFANGNRQLCRGGIKYCKYAKPVFGGSGNVAAGLSLLGDSVAFVGKAGNDEFGRLYDKNLQQSGILSRIFYDKKQATGVAIVYVEEHGERSFLVSRGANDTLSTIDVMASEDLIRESKYVYLTGCSLIRNPQRAGMLKAFELAKKYKKKIVFDPGAYNIVKTNRTLLTGLLKDCAVFSPNLEEAKAVTNRKELGDVINQLRKMVPLAALKCGKNGSIFITPEKTLRAPPFVTNCLDTTGAGDAFVAALIHGLINGQDIEAIALFANWFAAQMTAKIGARSFPTRSKIDKFLNSNFVRR